MDHAEVVRDAYRRISAGDIDGLGELMADDLVEHEEMPGLAPGKAGVLDFFRMLRSAFPDLNMVVEDVIVGDGKAVARVTSTGTQRGEFMGIPATDKAVRVQLIDIMAFNDAGLVSEHWGVTDMLSMMQQLGVVPDGPPA